MQQSETVLSVTRLVELLKETVEENFVQVAVEGEISNLARPGSGHVYFTLKDKSAQVRAVLFRPVARLLKFEPEDGLQVVCRGRVSVYRQRGELQMIVDAMEPVGAGSLQLAFEQLKKKLAAEGLFDPARKKGLPLYPERIGIVTSATGAAIHDILQVLLRRGAGLEVRLWPVRVQGEGAAAEIAAGIETMNRLDPVDILIVGRGGGSLEDLWAFNEEIVARAIAASKIPVISAVGHEVDFTIADFVADMRAATPTAAAEQVTRNRLELQSHIDQLRLRLAAQMDSRLHLLRERLGGLQRRLVSPEQQLVNRVSRLQECVARLQRGMEIYLDREKSSYAALAGRLDLLSPLKTLERGYAIAMQEDGSAVRRSDQLVVDEPLQVKFAVGSARVRVEEIGP